MISLCVEPLHAIVSNRRHQPTQTIYTLHALMRHYFVPGSIRTVSEAIHVDSALMISLRQASAYQSQSIYCANPPHPRSLIQLTPPQSPTRTSNPLIRKNIPYEYIVIRSPTYSSRCHGIFRRVAERYLPHPTHKPGTAVPLWLGEENLISTSSNASLFPNILKCVWKVDFRGVYGARSGRLRS